MNELLDGHVKPNPLASLAGRLTDPQDRETYAELISYVGALPPSDEFPALPNYWAFSRSSANVCLTR